MPRNSRRMLLLRLVVVRTGATAGTRMITDRDSFHSRLWIDGVEGETRSGGIDRSSIKRIGVTAVRIERIQRRGIVMTTDQLILTLVHRRRVPVLVSCGIVQVGHIILPVVRPLDPLTSPGRGSGSRGRAVPFAPIHGATVGQAVQAASVRCSA